MPIVAGDIDFHLSGVGGTPATSLGGAINATQIVDATSNNLFDVVSSAETSSGDTEYRCFYIKNNHATLTLQNAITYMVALTPSTDTSIEIALGTSAVNGIEQTIVDESTAPLGVTWETGVGSANNLAIGDIPPQQHMAVWLKRVVAPGASAYTDDNVVINATGDTAA